MFCLPCAPPLSCLLLRHHRLHPCRCRPSSSPQPALQRVSAQPERRFPTRCLQAHSADPSRHARLPSRHPLRRYAGPALTRHVRQGMRSECALPPRNRSQCSGAGIRTLRAGHHVRSIQPCETTPRLRQCGTSPTRLRWSGGGARLRRQLLLPGVSCWMRPVLHPRGAAYSAGNRPLCPRCHTSRYVSV